MTAIAPRVEPSDPRQREDGLGWVTRALFPGDGPPPVLGSGRGRPAGDGPSWAVVPSAERARFLIPLGNRRAAGASVLAYNALRGASTRAVRAAVGVLARAGAVDMLPFPVLSAPSAPLLDHLAERLGVPSLVAALGVRPPDPNRKPTLQLFDPAGRPCGYAKIGWNGATRDLVRAEAAALLSLPAPSSDLYPITPLLAYEGEWQDRVIGVTAPLPADVRRLPDPDRPRTAEMLAVARRDGEPTAPRELADYLHSLDPVAGDVESLRWAIDALRARSGSVPVEYGDWHGDWVPWNLATRGDRLVAWDWEHRGIGVPVGFDLAHQAFNTALVVGGRPVARAAAAADEALLRFGGELGIAPEAAGPVVDAYLIEMWWRTCRLAAGGAGWNTDLYPSLPEVLKRRLS